MATTSRSGRPTEKAKVSNVVIQAEINAHKVDIDRSVFVKTESEKDMLKHLKSLYKRNA
jgi:hypothetical protein